MLNPATEKMEIIHSHLSAIDETFNQKVCDSNGGKLHSTLAKDLSFYQETQKSFPHVSIFISKTRGDIPPFGRSAHFSYVFITDGGDKPAVKSYLKTDFVRTLDSFYQRGSPKPPLVITKGKNTKNPPKNNTSSSSAAVIRQPEYKEITLIMALTFIDCIFKSILHHVYHKSFPSTGLDQTLKMQKLVTKQMVTFFILPDEMFNRSKSILLPNVYFLLNITVVTNNYSQLLEGVTRVSLTMEEPSSFSFSAFGETEMPPPLAPSNSEKKTPYKYPIIMTTDPLTSLLLPTPGTFIYIEINQYPSFYEDVKHFSLVPAHNIGYLKNLVIQKPTAKTSATKRRSKGTIKSTDSSIITPTVEMGGDSSLASSSSSPTLSVRIPCEDSASTDDVSCESDTNTEDFSDSCVEEGDTDEECCVNEDDEEEEEDEEGDEGDDDYIEDEDIEQESSDDNYLDD